MAFDSSTRAKITSVTEAAIVVQTVQETYRQAKAAQSMLQRYTAATDPNFNAAVNAMLSSAERTELGQMLAQINALVTDWEANHPSVLVV